MPSSTAARQPVIKVEKWGICLNTADDHTGGGMSWMPHEEPDGRQEWNLTEVTAFYMISKARPIRTAASGTKWSSLYEVGLLPVFEKIEGLNMPLGGKGGAGLGSNFDDGISVRIW